MEVYKDLSDPTSQEFEKLLNSQLSKINIEEGKIINGKINKITEKFVFLFVEGLKSEPVLDINELKSMGLADKIKIVATVIKPTLGRLTAKCEYLKIWPEINLAGISTSGKPRNLVYRSDVPASKRAASVGITVTDTVTEISTDTEMAIPMSRNS